jgi:hypothetical protein
MITNGSLEAGAMLFSHLRFLISVHSAHEGFGRRARLLVAVLERLTMDEAAIFKSSGPGGKISQQALQFKLGMYACTGRPLPPELVVLWARMHPFTAKDPEVQRTGAYHRAFGRHFARTLPKGLRLSKELPDLIWSYRPSHPSMGVYTVPTGRAKKVWDHVPTLQTLGMISRKALDDCAKAAPPTEHEPVPAIKKPGKPQRPAVPAAEPVEPRSAPKPDPAPVAPSTAAVPTRRWSTWKAPGTEVRIAGMTILDGMLYAGYGPGGEESPLDLEGASSLDIALPVQRPLSDAVGAVPDGVPGYGALTPQQRWHYLRWLQGRRRTRDVPAVFPRLFIQGLERRLVDLVEKIGPRIQSSDPVLGELERLRSGFSDHPEIVSYAEDLATLVGVVRSAPPSAPPWYSTDTKELPFSLIHGLGDLVAAKKPLTRDWAAEWIAHQVRPDRPEKFRERALTALSGIRLPQRMDQEVPGGLPDLVFTYRARCPGLGEVDVVLDGIPDLSDVEPPPQLVEAVLGRTLPPNPAPPSRSASPVLERPPAPAAFAMEKPAVPIAAAGPSPAGRAASATTTSS